MKAITLQLFILPQALQERQLVLMQTGLLLVISQSNFLDERF